LLNDRFWLGVLAMATLLPLARRHRTAWYGVLNTCVLALWLGPRIAGAAVVFTFLLWGLLFAVLRLRHSPKLFAALASLFLPGLLLLFCLHKVHLEHPGLENGGAGAPALLVLRLLAALSFSYVMLRAYDLIRATLSNRVPLANPLVCLGYLFPTHMLLAGPVNSYGEHLAAEKQEPPADLLHVCLRAANHLVTGLLYKLVLAEFIRRYHFGSGEITIHTWLDTAWLLVYLFFDFAGYSRLAVGLGLLLRIPTPDNFHAPFLSRTVTELFTRWHISLGKFMQRNVYAPLQLQLVRRLGTRRARVAGLVSLLIAWLFVALWHRLSLAFLAYGLGMAGLVWVEKAFRDRALKTGWGQSRLCRWAGMVLGPVYVFVAFTSLLHLVSKELFLQ
jgi:D-alanyl-lipoteichoic acid acyltransferase DltB (MBOAT superfamily)